MEDRGMGVKGDGRGQWGAVVAPALGGVHVLQDSCRRRDKTGLPTEGPVS
jgi:hypothetical protein